MVLVLLARSTERALFVERVGGSWYRGISDTPAPCTQSVIQRPTAAISPGSVRKIQNLRPHFRLMHSYPRAALTKYHTLGSLHNRNLLSHILEATCLRSRCWQNCSLLFAVRENPCQTSLLIPGTLPVVFGILCLVDVSPGGSLLSCSHGILPLLRCPSSGILFTRTPIILDWAPTLL